MAKYIFNDNTKLLFIKDNYILVENKKNAFKKKLDSSFYEKLLDTCRKHYIFNSSFFSKNELNFLEKNLIVKKVSPILDKFIGTKYEKFQIYLENILFDANKMDYIKNNGTKKVLFVGAGGICTAMIDYLISVGITQFGVVDFDIVDITNFNRQFKYKENDIGHSKIAQLKENLNTQYKNLIIVPYEKKISSTLELKEILEDYNPSFVICSADTPILLIQKYVAEACSVNNIPCIFGGVGQKSGSFGPLLYNKKGFCRYLKEINKILNNVVNIFPCKGSFSITNSLISNYMASDVIFYLMNKKEKVKSLNKKCELDFDRDEIYEKEKY